MDPWDLPLPPVDLSARAKLRLAGPDATRFLNGQITADPRKLEEGVAMPACILDARGRLQALAWVRRERQPDGTGGFLLDVPSELRETAAARLERYIIADDVMLQDVTDDFFLVFSEESPDAPAGAAGHLRSSRYGRPGVDLWIPRNGGADLSGLNAAAPEDPRVEATRIMRGVPAWPHDLDASTLPGEAGLDIWAVDFAKGCYIGQEVVSRMKSVGHPARVLRRLRCDDSTSQTPSAGWILSEPGGKAAGAITSAAPGEIFGIPAALGYVKWSCNAEELLASPPESPESAVRMKIWK